MTALTEIGHCRRSMKSCLTTRSDVRAWFFSAITPLLFVLPRRLVHAPNRIIVTPESTRFTRTFAVLPAAVVYGRPMTSYSGLVDEPVADLQFRR